MIADVGTELCSPENAASWVSVQRWMLGSELAYAIGSTEGVLFYVPRAEHQNLCSDHRCRSQLFAYSLG
jgi:hypothetical protein